MSKVEEKLKELHKSSEKGVEPESNETEWLIKGMFKNTPEGVQALVKSYNEQLSRYDKQYNPLKQNYDKLVGKTKQLLALDTFINKNPDVVKFINDKLEKKETKIEEPKEPEDFNVADIYAKGTSSHKYQLDMFEYYKQLGVQEANERIGKIEKRLEKKEGDTKALSDLKVELGKQNFSAEEIKNYIDFTNNPENATLENSIVAFRAINGIDKSNLKPEEKPTEKPINEKEVSAVSNAGKSDTPIAVGEIDKGKFWDRIMGKTSE